MTILDDDLALGYRLEHYPDLMSSFACLSDAQRPEWLADAFLHTLRIACASWIAARPYDGLRLRGYGRYGMFWVVEGLWKVFGQ